MPATEQALRAGAVGAEHVEAIRRVITELPRDMPAAQVERDAAVIPAVLNSRSEPLDIGRRTRTVPTALRRALVLRDRGCAFPGCTVPASWCGAHHRQHWADGGATALPNLVLLGGVHHELIHSSDWQVQLPDGVPEFIPPPYYDPDQNPRRNPIHHDVSERRRDEVMNEVM